ncbi:N-6 DNA methylase [Clostridium perfringens]|uniref:N-6 DNA methylase n=1 Tax=Clostridium perfringens TaxID=1502 RepID=UPI001ABB097F|nr:N-6 DNA methylase [Clostridium perfringens]MBO3334080.1 N-6 DNA methylase [Clostridium perfringens]
MFYKKLRNKNNEIISNVFTKKFTVLESNNEKNIETHFQNYIEQPEIGWKLGVNFQRDSDLKERYRFRNTIKKTINSKPDCIFYDDNKNIIALGDLKNSSVKIKKGILEAKSYVECLNKDYGLNVRIAISYNGKEFAMEYLCDNGVWETAFIDKKEIDFMPSPNFLKFISDSENVIEEIEERVEINREVLKNFFKRCDEVFRTSSIGSSATEKFVELSTIIFIKIFSLRNMDEDFKRINRRESIWNYAMDGSKDIINGEFLEWLNSKYTALNAGEEQAVLITSKGEELANIARLVDKFFTTYQIEDFTSFKGDILEFFQNESKDRKIGEFFTSRNIIKFMTALVNPIIVIKNGKVVHIDKCYDPTCGTGGFLIEVFKQYIMYLLENGIDDLKCLEENILYGTELKAKTALLARLNMIIIGNNSSNIINRNALGYVKRPVYKKDKDFFGNYIPVKKELADSYTEYGEVIWHIKGDRTKKLEKQASGKTYFKFDEQGNKIEVLESELKLNNGKKVAPTGEMVKKQKGKYYIVEPVDFFLLKNEMEEDKIQYKYSDIKSVNPLLISPTLTLSNSGVELPNPAFHSDFGNFNIVLANQPFGLSEPPKADALFINHMIASVKDGQDEETGRYSRIACIVGNGFLHDPNFEEDRKKLQKDNFIKAVISLPEKVFAPYVNTIKSNIILIEKRKPLENEKTYFIKITNDGLTQDNKRQPEPLNKNQLITALHLWNKWEEDYRYDEQGNKIRSTQVEKEGFAELHLLDSKSWSVNNYIKHRMPAFKYELREIGEFIEESNEKISPSKWANNEDEIVDIMGVSKRYGIVSSDSKIAREYNQEYKIIKENELAYNPSRVNIGSIALNNKGKDLLISPSYVVLKINERISPQYLMFYLKSEFGRNQIEDYNFGTVRNSLDFNDLCKIKIPYIPIEEQKRFLILVENNYKSFVNLQDSFNALSKSGIPDYIFNQYYKEDEFEEIPFGSMIVNNNSVTYGLSKKSDESQDGTYILKMNNIYPIIDDILDENDIDKITLDKNEIVKYKIYKNDILINRTNSLDLVGKTGVFRKDCEAVYASYLMKATCKENYSPEYVSFFMNLSSTKNILRGMAEQSNGQYNINFEKVKKLVIKYPKNEDILKKYINEFEKYCLSMKSVGYLSDVLDKEIESMFNHYMVE